MGVLRPNRLVVFGYRFLHLNSLVTSTGGVYRDLSSVGPEYDIRIFFNCSQTKFVAIILVLSVFFYAIFRLTNFSSDAFDFSSSKTGLTGSAQRALCALRAFQVCFSSNCLGDLYLYLWCEGRFLEVDTPPPFVDPPPPLLVPPPPPPTALLPPPNQCFPHQPPVYPPPPPPWLATDQANRSPVV